MKPVVEQRDSSALPLREMRSFAEGLHDDLGPMFGRDVVRLVDAYERAIYAVKDLLDAGERDRAGFPIESEEWYARRDYARIQVEDSGV